MRNLVVCCDGTSNQFSADRTNVVKLFYALEQDPARQLVYYHPGLGTMEPPGALTTVARIATRLAGLAFGYGLPIDVRDAYVFLMNHYQPGDDIYLFGFSRGAYVVRAVAALIHAYGLIPIGNEPLVPYAVRNLVGVVSKSKTQAEIDAALALAQEFKDTFDAARRCTIHFVGVWDTVSSVGWITNPLVLPYTADNASILHGRHAVAIDERRAFFRTNLWDRNDELPDHGPREQKQVWFSGSHCDIGGGYPEPESGLAKIALQWMLEEAAALGLLVHATRKQEILGATPASRFARPTPGARPHKSLKSWWWIAEYVPKPNRRTGQWRINRGKPRRIPPGAMIHESVLAQPQAYRDLLPPDHVLEPPKAP